MAFTSPKVSITEIDTNIVPRRNDLIAYAWHALCSDNQEVLDYAIRCDKVFDNNSCIASSLDALASSLVVNAYPTLIAADLVSVQPMTAPSGLVYAMNYRYSDECPPNAISRAWSDHMNGLGTTFWSGQDEDNVTRYRPSGYDKLFPSESNKLVSDNII